MKRLLRYMHKRGEEFNDRYFTLQQKAFQGWLKRTQDASRQGYRLLVGDHEETIFVSAVSKGGDVTFLFLDKGNFDKETIITNDIGAQYFDTAKGRWYVLYNGGTFFIAELVCDEDSLPPWYMLTESDREICFRGVRKLLASTCENSHGNDEEITLHELASVARFCMRGNVGVSLFVDGALRGSMIVAGSDVARGLVHAVRGACADTRFSRLLLDEVAEVTLQVSFFSGLSMPPLFSERVHNLPLPGKGYTVCRDELEGYYLPTIFCINLFPTLLNIAERLVCEKLGGVYVKKNDQELMVFDVVQLYEEPDSQVYYLSLGVAHRALTTSVRGVEGNVLLEGICTRGYSYIWRLLQKDIAPPAQINPQNDVPVYHSVREMFLLYALVVYSRKNNRTEILPYARAVYDNVALHKSEDNQYEQGFLLAYTGCLSIELYGSKEGENYKNRLLKYSALELATPTLLLCVITHYFLNLGDESTAYEYAQEVVRRFREKIIKGEVVPLADFTDVIYFLDRFALGDEQELTETISFFLMYQNHTGSFYTTTAHSTPYTRGTSKMIEVLSRYKERNDVADAFKKALIYCDSLTIDKHSFFLDSNRMEFYTGAIMESEFSPVVHGDVLGHLFLAQ